MQIKSQLIVDIAAAFVLPFLIVGSFVGLATVFQITSLLERNPGVACLIVAEIVGFIFVVRQLKLKSLLVAIVYFPVMYRLLYTFAFGVACVFGNCL